MIKTLVLVGVLAVGPLQDAAKRAFDIAEKVVLGDRTVVVPKVEECPCGGKGVIKQGDGHVTTCPGTDAGPCKFRKMNDAQAEPEKLHAVVVMYSAKDNPDGTNPCIWCIRWKKNIMPNLVQNKWKVVERVAPGGRSVPYFEVYLYGKRYMHQGYMDSNALNKIIARAKQEAAVK